MKKYTLTLSIAVMSLGAFATTGTAGAYTVNGATQTGAAYIASTTSTTIAGDRMTSEATSIVWPEIKAKSAIVIDPVGNKIIYEKNADALMPTASLLKIMTAAVVDSFLNMNPKLAEKPVKVTSKLSYNKADRLLVNNSTWGVEDLTRYMLIGSSNKAADTLSKSIIGESAFVSYMNFKAKQFGLVKTKFYNATGIQTVNKKTKVEDPAGITTAREMATMFWAIIANHPGLLDITQYDKATFVDKKVTVEIPNTNRLMGDLPVRFGKTGFSDLAGGNLAIVLQKNENSHPYIVVVLGSTEEERFTDAYALATTTLAHYTK